MENENQNTNYLYYNMDNSFEHNDRNHIEAAIMAIEQVIASQKLKLHNLEKQRESLYRLIDNQFVAPYLKVEQPRVVEENTVASTSITAPHKETPTTNINEEDFKDYPHGEHLRVRLNYLDVKLRKPFKMRDRLDLIGKIEGEEAKEKLRKIFSGKLNYLMVTGFYIGAKYNNDNSLLFYFKPDWLVRIGDNKFTIKEEYRPSTKDFDFLPEHLRNEENITWVPEKKTNNA